MLQISKLPSARLLLRIVALTGLAADFSFPQDAPGVRRGTVETGVFAGASYGADGFRVMAGGNASYALNRVLLPYAEFSYFPGISRTAERPADSGIAKVSYDLPLYDFHGGFHISLPLPNRRIVPYGVIGVGVIHNLQTNYVFNYTLLGKSQSDTVTLPAQSNFAANFGAGLRYYANEHFGIRFEGKVYKASGDTIRGVFSKCEFGIFYQTTTR